MIKVKQYLWLLLLGVANQQVLSQPTYSSTVPASYVRSWTPVMPETNTENLKLQSTTNDIATLQTQYLDGLARPLQTITKKGSLATGGTAADAVTIFTYDEFGRERYKYLPFAANTASSNSSLNDGLLKRTSPYAQQDAFMDAQYSGQYGEGSYWYSKTNFETSGLERPVKSMAPGVNWVGAGRGVESKHLFNTDVDNVRMWDVTDNANAFGDYTEIGLYPEGVLYKSVTIDENSREVIEFKDKAGKLILKKVQLPATVDEDEDYDTWICTYYIYDKLNSLRCVIQPEGVKVMSSANDWTLSTDLLSEQCFRYEYDQRGRMIMKNVPGAGEVQMVYDARDRLIMTQDANLLLQEKWLVTYYDDLNRPLMTGLTPSSESGASHRANAYDQIGYPTWDGEKLTETQYDEYGDLPSGFSSSFLTTWNSHFLAADNIFPYPETPVQTQLIKGKVTWSMVKILGSDPEKYLLSVMLYDEKGRVIQVQSSNESDGVDVTTTQYSWAGQPLIIIQKHEKLGAGAQTVVTVTKLSYDELGRVIKVEKKISSSLVNSGAMSAYTTISTNEYDKLGQLKKKTIGSKKNSSNAYITPREPLEEMNYEYNVRGWMLGMNRDYTKDASSTNYFGFDLGYDKTNNNLINSQTYTAAQYNGNIAGMVWKSKGDGAKRKYDFSYDAANRLMKADFTQYAGSSFDQSAGVNYNMKMGDGSDVSSAYDNNGNILQMQQWGLKLTGSAQIDDLVYAYQSSSNKLTGVADGVTTDNKLGDFKDGVNTNDDYAYDANGNLVADQNKGIISIHYNYMNLPDVIETDKGIINYTYDAAGNKLKKLVTDNSITNRAYYTTTTYMAGMVYETKGSSSGGGAITYSYEDLWLFMGQEEGRVHYKQAAGAVAASLEYDYMLKDHLGNVRMVLTEERPPVSIYQATIEDAVRTAETALFTNIAETEIAKPTAGAGFDSDGANGKVSKLFSISGTDKRVGPGIVLKVMAGDKFKALVNAWYQAGSTNISTLTGVSDIVTNILNSITWGVPAGTSHTGTELATAGVLNSPVGSFLTYQNNSSQYNSSRPKAFLNWIVLDEEQFKLVTGNYGALQVPDINSSQQKQVMQANSGSDIEILQNGYLYVWVSNESQGSVYFDDLRVEHIRGPILEETHYYPFGLTMAGISSKALNGTSENKIKFQGQEFASQEFKDGSGLDIYEFKWRMHDPQIGRFWQIDPLSNKYVYNSTYAFSENKVTTHVELEGLEAVRIDEKIEAGVRIVVALISRVASKEANEMAKQSGLLGETDGLQDAYRHAYWTAKSAQVLTKKEALFFPVLHELGSPQLDPESPEYDPEAVKMDLFNNKVGADIGSDNPSATNLELDQLIKNALAGGKLRVIKTTTANINQEGSDPLIVEVPADSNGNPILNGDKTKKVVIPSSLPKEIPQSVEPKILNKNNRY